MADLIVVNVRDGSFQSRIKRIRKLPDMLQSTLYNWGKILERDIKESAMTAGIKSFTGGLFSKGIEWRQAPKGKIGRLFMRQYGVYLDSMTPHFVSVNKRRQGLLSWAGVASNPFLNRQANLVQQGKMKRFGVFVKPHPFILSGWNRARPKLNPMIRRESSKAIGGV